MSTMLDRSVRDSAVIPTMKCAQCNQEVHIRLIGQHQCPVQPPIPTLPKDFKSRGLSTFFDVAQNQTAQQDDTPRQVYQRPVDERKAIGASTFPRSFKPALNLLSEDPDASDDFDFSDILPGSASHHDELDGTVTGGLGKGSMSSPNRSHLPHNTSINNNINSQNNADIDKYIDAISPLHSAKSATHSISRLEEAREQLLSSLPAASRSSSKQGHAADTTAKASTATSLSTGNSPTIAPASVARNDNLLASSDSSSPAPRQQPKTNIIGNSRTSNNSSNNSSSSNTNKSHSLANNGLRQASSTSRGAGALAAGTAAKPQAKPAAATAASAAMSAPESRRKGSGSSTQIRLASSNIDSKIRISRSVTTASPQPSIPAPKFPRSATSPAFANSPSSSPVVNMSAGASPAQSSLDALSSLIAHSPASDTTSMTAGSPYELRYQFPTSSAPQTPSNSSFAIQSGIRIGSGQHQQRRPSPIPLPRLNTQIMGGRNTPTFHPSGRIKSGGPASAGSIPKSRKTSKLDSLLDDLMGEMQALNVEMRSESDRESVVSSSSFRHSPTSPSIDGGPSNAARKAQANSTISTSSTSSTLSSGMSCFACRGRIGNSNPAYVGSHVFHRMCFRCGECDRLLESSNPASFRMVPTKGEPDAVRYICDRHKSSSSPGQKPSAAQGQLHHSPPRTQLQCATCGVSISSAGGSIIKASDIRPGELPRSVQGVECRGYVYCRRDYKQQLGPVCKACSLPCTSTKDSIQALDSWWHRHCFNCQQCHKPFPDKSFYVFDQMPYCKYDYHKLNGSLCVACQEPIEGPCAQVYEGRFHPGCFSCYHCKQPLREVYYNLNGHFLCEQHIYQQKAFQTANKRKTVFGHI